MDKSSSVNSGGWNGMIDRKKMIWMFSAFLLSGGEM
jgi:hypothetical protein